MNPPDLLSFNDFGGDWPAYETELNRVFMTQIARGRLAFRGQPVRCRRHDEVAGRWASYWHLVQEGKVEEDGLVAWMPFCQMLFLFTGMRRLFDAP